MSYPRPPLSLKDLQVGLGGRMVVGQTVAPEGSTCFLGLAGVGSETLKVVVPLYSHGVRALDCQDSTNGLLRRSIAKESEALLGQRVLRSGHRLALCDT